MTRVMTLGALVGPVLFTMSWLVLGAVSPGYTMWDIVVPSYSPIAQPISGLGLGVTGPFMNAAFVASAALLFAGIVGIFRGIGQIGPRARTICIALLSLVPVGMAIDGIFTLESFFPHFLGYLVAIGSTVVSFLVVGSVLRGVPRWRWLGSGLRLGGGLTLVLLALAQLTFDPIAAGANVGIAGLTERLAVTEVLAWFVLMGSVALRTYSLESRRGLLPRGMPALPVLPTVEAASRGARRDDLRAHRRLR